MPSGRSTVQHAHDMRELTLHPGRAGNLSVAEDSFQVQARGSRPDEALNVALKLPLVDPARAEEAAKALRKEAKGEARSGPFGIKLGDLLPIPGFDSATSKTFDSPADGGGGGHFSLRCGQLLMSAEVILVLQSCS